MESAGALAIVEDLEALEDRVGQLDAGLPVVRSSSSTCVRAWSRADGEALDPPDGDGVEESGMGSEPMSRPVMGRKTPLVATHAGSVRLFARNAGSIIGVG